MTQPQIKPIQVSIYPDGRMDTKNGAAYLGLAEKTLAMKRCKGEGPKFVKLGRVFYFKDDLDAWVNAEGRLSSTGQAKRAASSMRGPSLITNVPGPSHHEDQNKQVSQTAIRDMQRVPQLKHTVERLSATNHGGSGLGVKNEL